MIIPTESLRYIPCLSAQEGYVLEQLYVACSQAPVRFWVQLYALRFGPLEQHWTIDARSGPDDVNVYAEGLNSGISLGDPSCRAGHLVA